MISQAASSWASLIANAIHNLFWLGIFVWDLGLVGL
jgi:hypothetical protein